MRAKQEIRPSGRTTRETGVKKELFCSFSAESELLDELKNSCLPLKLSNSSTRRSHRKKPDLNPITRELKRCRRTWVGFWPYHPATLKNKPKASLKVHRSELTNYSPKEVRRAILRRGPRAGFVILNHKRKSAPTCNAKSQDRSKEARSREK